MKKNITKALIGLISLTSMSSLNADESHIPAPGNEIVRVVKESYQEGAYDQFLRELHAHYEQAGKAGVLRGIFENMKAAMPLARRSEDLKRERNQKLLEATLENSDLAVRQKVESLVIAPSSMKVFAELEALKYHVPEENLAEPESTISAIETEYHIKSALLEIAGTRSESSLEERYKKIAALQFEKMEKLQKAASGFEKSPWQEKLAKARSVFDTHLSAQLDYLALKDLAIGKIDPSNPTEEKVKEIMSSYLAQR